MVDLSITDTGKSNAAQPDVFRIKPPQIGFSNIIAGIFLAAAVAAVLRTEQKVGFRKGGATPVPGFNTRRPNFSKGASAPERGHAAGGGATSSPSLYCTIQQRANQRIAVRIYVNYYPLQCSSCPRQLSLSVQRIPKAKIVN
jgi:hypothetical protein